jgi:hypothetical protein
MNYIYIICLLYSSIIAFGQETVKRDSTRKPKINLEELKPEAFTVESDFNAESSYGWFPSIPAISTLDITGMGTPFFMDGIYQNSLPVKSNSFLYPDLEFRSSHPFVKKDVQTLYPFTMEETDDDIPEDDLWSIGIRRRISIQPLQTVLRIGTDLLSTNSTVYAIDRTKSYVGINGQKKPLEELHTILLKEYEVNISAGLEFSIYGAYLTVADMQVYSVYTTSIGAIGGFMAYSNQIYSSTIMSDREYIRYSNGSNVIILEQDKRLKELQSFRCRIEYSLGWQLMLGPIGLGIEGFVQMPLTPILHNSNWSTYLVGTRTSLMLRY